MIAKEFHEPLGAIFWHWPISKAMALWHVHLYAAGVTCEALASADEILEELKRIKC